MLNLNFPKELNKEYILIKEKFNKIRDDWKKYDDKIIPEDKEFAKQIINFVIQIIDYMIENYETLDLKKYQEFLASYDYEFFYGPLGDDSNYLTFDETLNNEPVTEFCWELKDSKFNISRTKLEEIKSKYSQVLLMF